MDDEGIIRARAKIEATISNARVYLAMKKEGENFSEFVWGMAGRTPMQKKRGYKFVGPVITYAWMQAVGMVNDHVVTCFRHPEVRAAAKDRQR